MSGVPVLKRQQIAAGSWSVVPTGSEWFCRQEFLSSKIALIVLGAIII